MTSKAIRQRVKAWIADKFIDVVITTGGTGFTGRDVTPEAVEPLFEKKMDGFSTLFLLVSEKKIGTSAIQTRATAGVANATYMFCLPGSPGACKDAWDEILVHQLDYRTGRAISWRSCRGSTSICGGRRRRAQRLSEPLAARVLRATRYARIASKTAEYRCPLLLRARRARRLSYSSKSQYSATTSLPQVCFFSLDVRVKPAFS